MPALEAWHRWVAPDDPLSAIRRFDNLIPISRIFATPVNSLIKFFEMFLTSSRSELGNLMRLDRVRVSKSSNRTFTDTVRNRYPVFGRARCVASASVSIESRISPGSDVSSSNGNPLARAPFRVCADHHRQPCKFGMPDHFDGREETVHIHEKYRPLISARGLIPPRYRVPPHHPRSCRV